MSKWKYLLLWINVGLIFGFGLLFSWGWIVSVILIILGIILLFMPAGKSIIQIGLQKRKKRKVKKENSQIKVIVGLSGGIDSAYSAYLLQQQGYQVEAFFMRNWDATINQEINNILTEDEICQQEEDYEDAKAVANFLKIPLHRLDLVDEYWNLVFAKFLEEIEIGLTPNPDILCNRFIKFDKFIDKIETKIGAFDYIAMGHYAKIKKENDQYYLAKAIDHSKDQTYFLAEIKHEVLPKIMFPLGNLTKKEIRDEAKKLNLPVATKKDSTGICFIGKRNFPEFISNYLKPNPGKILDIETNKVVGEHKGAFFYTIGQRRGLNLGGQQEAMYVVKKDLKTNIVYVGNENHPLLFSQIIKAINFNLLIDLEKENFDLLNLKVDIKIRHSIETHPATIIKTEDNDKNLIITVKTDHPISGVTAGQELVIYKDDIVIGGGQIREN